MNTFQKQTEAVKSSPLASKIAKGVVYGMAGLLFVGIGFKMVLPTDAHQSGLAELEASHKAQVQILEKTKESLCSTEVAIAKEKVGLHLEGKQTFDNYDQLTKKAVGENLDCSKL